MAPKKKVASPQGKLHGADPDQALNPPCLALSWRKTKIAESDLQAMVKRGLLPEKEIAHWKACLDEPFPGDAPFEVPVFTWQFDRSLTLPICFADSCTTTS